MANHLIHGVGPQGPASSHQEPECRCWLLNPDGKRELHEGTNAGKMAKIEAGYRLPDEPSLNDLTEKELRGAAKSLEDELREIEEHLQKGAPLELPTAPLAARKRAPRKREG